MSISASVATISVRRGSPYLLLISSSSFDDDVHQELHVAEDGAEARDLVAELAVLLGELLALEPGEPREAHLEDGLGLPLGEEIVACAWRPRRSRPRAGPRGARTPRGPCSGSFISSPRASSGSAAARMVLITRSTSVMAMPEAFDDLALGLGLGELVARCGVTTSRRCSMKTLSVSLRSRTAGRPFDDGQVDDAERRLQVRQPVELVQDHLREDVLLAAR